MASIVPLSLKPMVSMTNQSLVGGEFAAVGVDLAEEVAVALIEHYKQAGGGDELERAGYEVHYGQAGGRAKRRRLLAALHAFSVGFPGGGLKGLVEEREIGEEVQEIFGGDIFAQTVFAAGEEHVLHFFAGGAFYLPDSGEVGLALAAGRWGGQNRFAVFGARGSGCGLVDPLGRRRDGCSQ
jgi:hypothetical protein